MLKLQKLLSSLLGKEQLCQQVASSKNVEEAAIGRLHENNYFIDPSFRLLMGLRNSRNKLAKAGPEWRLNRKDKAFRYIRNQGFVHPEVFQARCKLNDLKFFSRGVIKPYFGANARGVYLIFSPERIFHPASQSWLGSWEALTKALKDDLATNRVRKDLWSVEELITEDEAGEVPGRDLKFYCFYGQVGLVLEVQRFQGLAYCEWDSQGQPLNTGKYQDQRFLGRGFTEEQKQIAECLSQTIPAPFMRIDFICSANHSDGMVFGEFTPRPGNLYKFDSESDKMLGEFYLKAERRLEIDFLRQKKFAKVFVK